MDCRCDAFIVPLSLFHFGQIHSCNFGQIHYCNVGQIYLSILITIFPSLYRYILKVWGGWQWHMDRRCAAFIVSLSFFFHLCQVCFSFSFLYQSSFHLSPNFLPSEATEKFFQQDICRFYDYDLFSLNLRWEKLSFPCI